LGGRVLFEGGRGKVSSCYDETILDPLRTKQQSAEPPPRSKPSSSERFALGEMRAASQAAPIVDSRIEVACGDPRHPELCDLLPPEAFHADSQKRRAER